jgi:hypothetical protein
MGNISSVNTNDFGKTQQEIGKASAEINVYISYFMCFVFILIGIGFIIFALTPTAPSTLLCNNYAENVDSVKACSIKTRKYWFLLGGLFIPLGLFIVWFSKWWKHKVDTNVGYANLAALGAEASIIGGAFNRRR